MTDYDLAKLSIWRKQRDDARERLSVAVSALRVAQYPCDCSGREHRPTCSLKNVIDHALRRADGDAA